MSERAMLEAPHICERSWEDYGGKLCRCSECGHVSRCTRDNDFYVRAGEPLRDAPLVCETCIRKSSAPGGW